MRPIHRPFAFGRLLRNDRRVIVLTRIVGLPIRGPWELRAVFGK